ncbi:MAG: anthranilate synthase component I family protein [Candidatus Magnetomorum sp.]|nr:anthranilate synthase component I family protein [Candidatus Magnetomorum sp.]
MTQLYVMQKEKLADIETPVSAYIKLCKGKTDSFLLESVEKKEITGRYSIIAYDPIFAMEMDDHQVYFVEDGLQETAPKNQFFDLIRTYLNRLQCETPLPLPTLGSLMGFVGYDAVRLIEKLPSRHHNQMPVARLVFPSRFIIFDHLQRMMTLFALDKDKSVCREKLSEMEQNLLLSPVILSPHSSTIQVAAPDKDRFCNAVSTAKSYIRAGDIFQVVLSDRFNGETDLSPFEVYRRLRLRSPSPYMFFLDFGDYQLVGSSPETLVKVNDRKAFIMAIAGTRGRSDNPEKDRALEKELLACDKETAEHIMLVDLARNDISRVAQYGTVKIDPYMSVVRYSHVMHIVSQVEGLLQEGTDAIDALKAGFPAGTVSGAPKVRAMEIIDELENAARGPYAGAVGYFGPNNAMDMCIAIRTILFRKNQFTIQVGAGIVADSVPENEYKEIQNKAAQSIAALETAARGDI